MDVCSVLTVRQPSQTAFLWAIQQATCLLKFTKNYRQKDTLPSHKTSFQKSYVSGHYQICYISQSFKDWKQVSLWDGNMILLRKSNTFWAKTGAMIKIGLCIGPLFSFPPSRRVLPADKTAVDSLTAIYHPQAHGKYRGLVRSPQMPLS